MKEDVSFKDIKLSHTIQPLEGVGYNLHEPTTNTATRHKVFFGNKMDEQLHRTLKVYASHNNLQICYVLEEALSEYFVSHREGFPANANLQIAIVQEPLEKKKTKQDVDKCTVGSCRDKSVAKGVYLQTDTEYNLCSKHLNGAYENPKIWKVL